MSNNTVTTRIMIRFKSGRESLYEIRVPEASSASRFRSWLDDPQLVLQTERALVIIPSSAIEEISIELTHGGEKLPPVQGIIEARQLT